MVVAFNLLFDFCKALQLKALSLREESELELFYNVGMIDTSISLRMNLEWTYFA